MSLHARFDNLVVARMADAGFHPACDTHSPPDQDPYIREFVGRKPAIIFATGLELRMNSTDAQLERLASARVKAIAFGDGSER